MWSTVINNDLALNFVLRHLDKTSLSLISQTSKANLELIHFKYPIYLSREFKKITNENFQENRNEEEFNDLTLIQFIHKNLRSGDIQILNSGDEGTNKISSFLKLFSCCFSRHLFTNVDENGDNKENKKYNLLYDQVKTINYEMRTRSLKFHSWQIMCALFATTTTHIWWKQLINKMNELEFQSVFKTFLFWFPSVLVVLNSKINKNDAKRLFQIYYQWTNNGTSEKDLPFVNSLMHCSKMCAKNLISFGSASMNRPFNWRKSVMNQRLLMHYKYTCYRDYKFESILNSKITSNDLQTILNLNLNETTTKQKFAFDIILE